MDLARPFPHQQLAPAAAHTRERQGPQDGAGQALPPARDATRLTGLRMQHQQEPDPNSCRQELSPRSGLFPCKYQGELAGVSHARPRHDAPRMTIRCLLP